MLYDGETACLPAAISVDPRSAYPAQRLVEDLRHDRLAARLCGMAGQALRLRAQARGQPAFLRQCADAICRACRAHRPAGRGRGHGRRVRQAAQGRGRRPQPAAGHVLRHAEGRVLRVSRTSSAPAGRRSRSPARCWKTPASPSSAGRISACSAKVMCACPTPIRPRTSCARSTGSAISWRAARRRSASAHSRESGKPARHFRHLDKSAGSLLSPGRAKCGCHYPFCVSWKPTTTTTSPMSCETLGTSPSARNPTNSVNGGTSEGNSTARPAPRSTTVRANR